MIPLNFVGWWLVLGFALKVKKFVTPLLLPIGYHFDFIVV